MQTLLRSLQFGAVLVLAFTFVQCHDHHDDSTQVSDYDTVSTERDPNADFSSYTTYALPDKIPFIDDNTTAASYLDEVNPSAAQIIRSEVRSNMNNRGYTEVVPDSTVDLLFNIGALNTTNQGVYIDDCGYYDDPFYWDWYPGWGWDASWSWDYYPCYGNTYFTYQNGSLTLDLVDVKKSIVSDCDNNNCSLSVAWQGVLTGLLDGNSATLNQRIKDGIDEAFDKSPYLKKN